MCVLWLLLHLLVISEFWYHRYWFLPVRASRWLLLRKSRRPVRFRRQLQRLLPMRYRRHVRSAVSGRSNFQWCPKTMSAVFPYDASATRGVQRLSKVYFCQQCKSTLSTCLPSVHWRCWLGGRKGVRPVGNCLQFSSDVSRTFGPPSINFFMFFIDRYIYYNSLLCHTHTHARTHTHPFNGFFSGTTRVIRYQKGKNQSGFYWSKRQWVAVVSAGPHASLHLAPDR